MRLRRGGREGRGWGLLVKKSGGCERAGAFTATANAFLYWSLHLYQDCGRQYLILHRRGEALLIVGGSEALGRNWNRRVATGSASVVAHAARGASEPEPEEEPTVPG
eukprot:1786239-Rhodomonas_salina.2